ncbi:MAG: histidine-type phosphatase [Bacteroidaceae bacterium]|nr:histidine-type phosphatase [Bacteroidaceae bacterium]
MLLSAQTAREEIHENILRSGSNHMAYIAPTKPLTKAPKGYEPFYISHYARHGSRWLINKNEYTSVISVFEEADERGKLTETGKKALRDLKEFYPCTVDRLGELTSVGERQHHGIGKRMTQNFPEVFSGNAQVDARSTVVIRCILSMGAECEEIAAFNGKVRFHNDVSESFQYYLNADWDKKLRESASSRSSIINDYKQKYTHPDRLMSVLFNDQAYVKDNVKAGAFMRSLFNVVNNMQSHDTDINLYPLFTEQECYDQWKWKNIEWYLGYGPAPQTKGNMPFSQKNLLRNVIATADTIVNNRSFNGATLRFGHEVCVMPYACLLELDSCGRQVEDLDHLEDYWVNYRIYPMGCNVQLVFYRPKKGTGDILVKALLNEKEATMPVKTDMYPYYRWEDLRRYYTKKLDDYDKR